VSPEALPPEYEEVGVPDTFTSSTLVQSWVNSLHIITTNPD